MKSKEQDPRDPSSKPAKNGPAAATRSEIRPVLVISSHVMTGAVGNRAAAFALERFGHPVWEVPTVILPWHPGHGPSTRQVIDAQLFAKSLEDLANHPDFDKLGAVMSGYLGSVEQIAAVAQLIDKLKAANPEALYLCDPVMGDENGLYISQDIAEAIRDQLVPRADIITPNRFEFNWLTESCETRNDALVARAATLGRPITLITSAFPLMRNAIGNLLINASPDRQSAILCEHPTLPNPPNGTGDMIAALFLTHKLSGKSDEIALKQASSAILEVVSRSSRAGFRDLEVARFGDRFYHPMAMVHMRMIGTAPKLARDSKVPDTDPDKERKA